MAITLITGTPGAGKTLRSIQLAVAAKKEGLTVFHVGIDDMDPRLIAPLAGGLEAWQTLPANSLLIVDEAHKYLPVRQPGRPPEWIQKLTEIRHFGIRLILVTQDPRNLDSFVRRLVGEHEHVSRKMGFGLATLRTFQGIAEDPNDYHAQKTSTAKTWKYPKDLFSSYTSATMHMVKRKIPWKVVGSLLVLLAFPVVLYLVYLKVPEIWGEKKPSASLTPAAQSGFAQGLSSNSKKGFATADDFYRLHQPLVRGVPWSAPLYAEAKPASSPPRLVCVVVGLLEDPQSTCRCFTEQATRVDAGALFCRKVAEEGIYYPFTQATAANSLSSLHATAASEAESAKPLPPLPGLPRDFGPRDSYYYPPAR